ncbi:MAG: hypothetical protein H6600_07025 [Flavobacteriales bacterium]|nr:hypothetical protein [Flavobacteriales bacterium]
MRLFHYLFLLSILLSCSEPESEVKENKSETMVFDTVPQHEVELVDFPEYTLKAKDTIVEIVEYDIINNKLQLGAYQTDTSSIEVITNFKLIPDLDNGYKGRSELFLIVNVNDTFRYEANSRKSLPIDLYKNHFVFINDLDQFVFVIPELITKEVVCLSNGWDECLVNF